MKWVFWGSSAVIAYTYFGYALYLWLRSRWRPRFVRVSPFVPFISIIMVVRNEAAVLERKLQNLSCLNYPLDRREIVVVSDGSTDRTNSILTKFSQVRGTQVILKADAEGKASGLSVALKVVSGEIVVFTDARQHLEADALQLLMQSFADPQVGCASGQLMLGDPSLGELARGTGLYWKIEKKIREMESICGSVVGATGAFYGVRRNLIVVPPAETILDDLYIPMHVVRQGARVVFEARARAWDVANLGLEKEFARKVRTLSGNYQVLKLAPWLLSRVNPIRLEFVSHKLMRLLVPFAMAAALISSLLLTGPIYRSALVLQVGFYGLSLWAWLCPTRGPLARLAEAAFMFVMLNAAALVAFRLFVSGRKVAWDR